MNQSTAVASANEVSPLPHLTGEKIADGAKKRWNWGGLILNGIAFLIGSAFLVWGGGFLFALVIERDSIGTMSIGDIIGLIVLALLGICSLVWLFLYFLKWLKQRKENVA